MSNETQVEGQGSESEPEITGPVREVLHEGFGATDDDALAHKQAPPLARTGPTTVPDLDDPEQSRPDLAVTRHAMRCVRCRHPIAESRHGRRRAAADGIDRLNDEKVARTDPTQTRQETLEAAIQEFRRLKLNGIADRLQAVADLPPDHEARLRAIEDAYERVVGVGMEGADGGLDLLNDATGE